MFPAKDRAKSRDGLKQQQAKLRAELSGDCHVILDLRSEYKDRVREYVWTVVHFVRVPEEDLSQPVDSSLCVCFITVSHLIACDRQLQLTPKLRSR